MATTAAKVISLAKKEVDYREGARNYTKYPPEVPGLGWAQNQPWCATFVSWLAMKTDNASVFPRTASCAAGVAWFRSKGRFSYYPAVGAQVFFGAGGGTHTGLVYAYDKTYIYTVEGNTNNNGSAEGNGVYLKKRSRKDAFTYGYGYPAYSDGIVSADPEWQKKPAPKPEPKPERRMEYLPVTGYLPELHYGDKGWHVGFLQKNLNRFFPDIKVTEIYDKYTAQLVDQFYKKYLDFDTTTNGHVFGADGWRRVLSIGEVA